MGRCHRVETCPGTPQASPNGKMSRQSPTGREMAVVGWGMWWCMCGRGGGVGWGGVGMNRQGVINGGVEWGAGSRRTVIGGTAL